MQTFCEYTEISLDRKNFVYLSLSSALNFPGKAIIHILNHYEQLTAL